MKYRVVDHPLDLHARLKLGVHLRLEESDAIAAVGFALVERQIRAFQQPFGIIAVLWCQRDTDAHR